MKKNQNIDSRFWLLLEKFQAGKCSLNELYELETFFGKDEFASSLEDQMYHELDSQMYPVAASFSGGKIFRNLRDQITQNEGKSEVRNLSVVFNWIKIAAIVVLSFVFGGLAVYFATQKPEVKPVISYCEVVAPFGSISQVTLPDSSIVWLNAGSKLKYSTDFNLTNRDLNLEGEGYFKIAKNKALPFVVDAFGFLVEAVGTEFNVKAYKEEPTIETILVEGKVKLDHETENIAENVYLSPKYKATFYKDANNSDSDGGHPRLVISPNIDPLPLISWKEDRFIFKSELLRDLVVKLERKYNFSFQFNSEDVKDYRFTGTIEGETLQQVMDVIKITSPISYEIRGKNVIINKDQNRIRNFEKHLKQ